MAVDPRQVVAGFLTLSMFVMLGNMIKHDHFSSGTEFQKRDVIDKSGYCKVFFFSTDFGHAVTNSNLKQLSMEATGVEFNSVKVVDNVEMTDAERVGVDHLMEADEELKSCWASPRPKDQLSNGFVTFSLTIGPEYHISQITDAVVIARYLGAALVLPEVRGLKLGNTRKFEDVYDVGKFMRSLNGVVKVIHELPDEVSARKPAVIRVPDQVTEDIISEIIQPIFQKNNCLRLAVVFSSVSFQPKETNNKDLDSTACLAMFSSLQLKPEYSEVAKQMLARLKESSKESEGVVLAIDLQKDLLEKKSCRSNESSRRKGCYYPHEVLGFLRKVGFSANTTIYLTETWGRKDLNALKEAFPNTYTKASY
ncbi:hypothetical protein PR202_ga15381 [Eleusine coracana subsp. coracana]|uniref:O-fucosyltransferase family protein n=1 Tax=Eleusine coracana subsp. coracana TaxID=191504 RepID=A0AAV5CK24_ELECO|nr:hypothetical protein PR202_ga15381 [Eleusine coracana subsp. coracana]